MPTQDDPPNTSPPQRHGARWPIEIAFLATHGVGAALLDDAVVLAELHDISADKILIAEGWISERRFYESLARTLQLPFSVAAFRTRTGVFNRQAAAAGMAALATNQFVAAPSGHALCLLLEQGARGTAPDAHLTITTPSHLAHALFLESAAAIAQQASFALSEKGGHLSAARNRQSRRKDLVHIFLVSVILGSMLAPGLFALALSIGWSTLILSSLVMRLFICAASGVPPPRHRRLRTQKLPIYTILVPLAREARILRQLIGALDALDYPAAKLQILLVIEADDNETAAALGAVPLAPKYEIVVAPLGQPRTKPRALNVALARARGTLLTVYDAEDVPEPQQLRAAAERFAGAPETLACLQAQLAIHNANDSWLTRLFALEYAALKYETLKWPS